MKKRILPLLLLAAATVSLLTAPAMAARDPNRFTDLYDNAALMPVESPRLMGVMGGFSDGSFRPNGELTRAQFCKMVVCSLNAEDELGLYRAVTLGQAATILLRVLGYKDENAGGVWGRTATSPSPPLSASPTASTQRKAMIP